MSSNPVSMDEYCTQMNQAIGKKPRIPSMLHRRRDTSDKPQPDGDHSFDSLTTDQNKPSSKTPLSPDNPTPIAKRITHDDSRLKEFTEYERSEIFQTAHLKDLSDGELEDLIDDRLRVKRKQASIPEHMHPPLPFSPVVILKNGQSLHGRRPQPDLSDILDDTPPAIMPPDNLSEMIRKRPYTNVYATATTDPVQPAPQTQTSYSLYPGQATTAELRAPPLPPRSAARGTRPLDTPLPSPPSNTHMHPTQPPPIPRRPVPLIMPRKPHPSIDISAEKRNPGSHPDHIRPPVLKSTRGVPPKGCEGLCCACGAIKRLRELFPEAADEELGVVVDRDRTPPGPVQILNRPRTRAQTRKEEMGKAEDGDAEGGGVKLSAEDAGAAAETGGPAMERYLKQGAREDPYAFLGTALGSGARSGKRCLMCGGRV